MSIGQLLANWLKEEEDVPEHNKLITKAVLAVHENQCQHIVLGCLKDIEGPIMLKCKNGKRKILRGTNNCETWHHIQNVESNQCGPQMGELKLFNRAFEYNVKKNVDVNVKYHATMNYKTYDLTAIHDIRKLHQDLCRSVATGLGPGLGRCCSSSRDLDVTEKAVYEELIDEKLVTSSLFGVACFTEPVYILDPSSVDSAERRARVEAEPHKHIVQSTRAYWTKLKALQQTNDNWTVAECAVFQRLLRKITNERENKSDSRSAANVSNTQQLDADMITNEIISELMLQWNKLVKSKETKTSDPSPQSDGAAAAVGAGGEVDEEAAATIKLKHKVLKHMGNKTAKQLLDQFSKTKLLGMFADKETVIQLNPPAPYVPDRFSLCSSSQETASAPRAQHDENDNSKYCNFWSEREKLIYEQIINEFSTIDGKQIVLEANKELFQRMEKRFAELADEMEKNDGEAAALYIIKRRTEEQIRNRWYKLSQKRKASTAAEQETKEPAAKLTKVGESELDVHVKITPLVQVRTSPRKKNAPMITASLTPLPSFITASTGMAFTNEESILLETLAKQQQYRNKQEESIRWSQISQKFNSTVHIFYDSNPLRCTRTHPPYYFRTSRQLRDKMKTITLATNTNASKNNTQFTSSGEKPFLKYVQPSITKLFGGPRACTSTTTCT